MIKKQKFITNLIFIIIILQLFSLSINSSGLLTNKPINNLLANAVDDSLIDAVSCSELAQWDNNYGAPQDIFVQETLMSKIAYITLGSAGLLMYDISNPTAAKFLGHYKDGDYIEHIIVKGKNAFVTGDDYGLRIIDVSSPKNPKFIMDYSEVEYLSDIEMQDDYIFGLEMWTGLHVIDIRNPKNPNLVDTYSIYENDANEIRIKDNFLYLVGLDSIEILDISNPQHIFFVTIWDFDVGIYSFDFYGLTAIISDYGNVLFYNISNPSNFTLITKYYDVRCRSISIQVVDHYVFSFGYRGFICFDVENPNNIVKVNEFIRRSGFAFRGLIHDEFIYLIDYSMGIEIVYIGDLTITPLSAGKIITGGYTRDAFVQGNLAYISNLRGGLEILDVDNPTNPKLICKYTESSSYYTSIYLENNKLYLTDYATKTIEILDVSDPTSPERLSSLYDDFIGLGLDSDMIVKDDIVFVIDIAYHYPSLVGMLNIVNCTNPANVSVINSMYNQNAVFYDFYLVENHIFLATSEGLLIYEISNEYNLTLISEYSEISSSIGGVFVRDDVVYLAARDYGLIILDISDIENPILISSYDTNGASGFENGCYNIYVESSIIYLTDFNDGLLFFDGKNPYNPILIGSYIRRDYNPFYGYNMIEQISFYEIFVSENVVYLSSGYSGLLIVHHDDLPTHWMSIQNIIIISITTTVPFFLGGLIVFVIWRIKKRR